MRSSRSLIFMRMIALVTVSAAFHGQVLAETLTYESIAPVMQTRASAGHYILVLSNRELAPWTVEVLVTAYDKHDPRRSYRFPAQRLEIPAGERNPITNDPARAGATLISFKLQEAGFDLARIETKIKSDGSRPDGLAPTRAWAVFVTEKHGGNPVYFCDRRQFRLLP